MDEDRMKQVLQDARSGALSVEDVPTPALRAGGVLVHTAASVVSAGTERGMLAFAEKSLLGKARERPDLVRQVWDKVRRDGIAQTLAAVNSRLDHPTPLGYSSSGTVVEVGERATGLMVGDRVVCAGAGYAVHGEIVYVPRNLCAPVPARPDGTQVPFEEAAFATLGAIALHGVRLAAPTLGERVVVIGLGAIGQLAAQLLTAHGCTVLGVDRDADRVRLACELGAEGVAVKGDESPVEAIMAFTRGRGADAVVIAAGTDSNGPIELAGDVSRRKGRVIVVGAVRMDVPRRSYYERELSLMVSCSYGPGRYDPQYELEGVDYPLAYVRWTEQRNLEAFVDLLAAGRLDVRRLITHRIPLSDAGQAYALLDDDATERSLGIVLTYPSALPALASTVAVPRTGSRPVEGRVTVAAIGAGSFARSMLFPLLRATADVRLRTLTAASGLSAARSAQRFGFEHATTDVGQALADPEVNTVVIATPHRTHAALAMAALESGRHVFLEKPLCVNEQELTELSALYRSLTSSGAGPLLMVGFNRRFSPLAERVRVAAAGLGPLEITYRVNAGRLPAGHWLEAPEEGGRIVGEGCHFIDLAVFLTGSLPVRVSAMIVGGAPEPGVVVVRFADGSVLTLNYVTSGGARLPKERIEVAAGGRSWVIDDWRTCTSYVGSSIRRERSGATAKGHREEIARFVAAVRAGGPEPIPFEQLVATTRATFSALESARSGAPVDVPRA
jgi:predicted dehydrogenase